MCFCGAEPQGTYGGLMSFFANKLETRKEGETTTRFGNEAESEEDWTAIFFRILGPPLLIYTENMGSQSKRAKKWGK